MTQVRMCVCVCVCRGRSRPWNFSRAWRDRTSRSCVSQSTVKINLCVCSACMVCVLSWVSVRSVFLCMSIYTYIYIYIYIRKIGDARVFFGRFNVVVLMFYPKLTRVQEHAQITQHSNRHAHLYHARVRCTWCERELKHEAKRLVCGWGLVLRTCVCACVRAFARACV